MKKLITVAVVCMLVLSSGSTAFAAGQYSGGGQNGSGSTTQTGGTMQMMQNGQVNQAGLAELARNREQIRVNREEIIQLRTQIRDCGEQLRQQIRSQLQDRENVDTAEMQQLREAVRNMRQARLSLITEHQGKIQEQLTMMYQARIQRNLGTATQALHNIQVEQQQRIADLTKLLDDMQTLLETI